MTSDKWLTVNDICQYLKVSNETVYSWIDKHDMPGYRVGRRWMFKQSEIDKWVHSGKAADKAYSDDNKVKIMKKG